LTVAVEIKNLVQEFKLGKVKIPALNDVSLTVNVGEFICLLGPSGSGKSTLLNLIGGLDRFVSGRIIVNSMDISKLDENQLAAYRRNAVGFVFQSYNLIPTMTALQNVELPLVFSGLTSKNRYERALDLLKEVGLESRLNHRPTELSGGEQQRVAIARALVNNPTLVLADEPTGNLDTHTGEEIMRLMKEVNQKRKTTFIVVTHNVDLSVYADRVVYIRDGVVTEKEVN
jgi:putative ABC transport system ATP-binding protein